MPDADREHVLQRARDLAADDVGVRVHAERRGHEHRLQRRRRLGVVDRDHRRGRLPGATSRARFGPVSTPMRSAS